jgi:hypothetical protein
LAVLFIVIVTVLGTGCEFTNETTPYPAFLPYVIAEIDLSGTLPSSIRETRMEATAFPLNSRRFFSIVVRPDSAAADTMIVVDENFATLLIERSETVLSFDTSLFINANNAVQLGNLNYNPSTGVVSNVIRREDIYSPIFAHPSDYVIFETDSATAIAMRRFAFDWSASVSGDTILPAFSDGRETWQTTARYRYSPTGATEVTIFVTDTTGRTYLRTVDWQALDIGAPPFAAWIEVTADTVSYSRVDFDSVQDTPAGLLFVDNDRGGLVRVRRSSGSLIDTFDPGENPRSDDRYPVVFDPAGEFYLLLDTEARILYKVAPWW